MKPGWIRNTDRALVWAAGMLGIGLLVLLAVENLARFDGSFDFLAYHAPFAIKIFDPDRIVLHPFLEERFKGFPLLIHLFMGLAWKAVPWLPLNAMHMIGWAFLCLAGLVVALGDRSAAAWFLPAALACPLVFIHCRIGYIDLPANLLLCMGLICLFRLRGDEKTTGRPFWAAGACLFLVLCGWSKYTVLPLALLAALFLAGVLARDTRLSRSYRIALIVLVLGGTPLFLFRNYVRFHNPIYPVKMPVASSHFPYVHDPAAESPQPPGFRKSPQWIRTLASILEISRAKMVEKGKAYTYDQWGRGPDSKGFRMGGFWPPLLFFHFLVLAWGLRKRLLKRFEVLLFALLAGITLFIPQSHQLRYYLYIPVMLAWFTARVLRRLDPAYLRIPASAVLLLLVGRSLQMDRAYLRIEHRSVRQLAERYGIHWEGMTPGETVCGRNTANVLVLLTGPTFREYRVVWSGAGHPCPKGLREFKGSFYVSTPPVFRSLRGKADSNDPTYRLLTRNALLRKHQRKLKGISRGSPARGRPPYGPAASGGPPDIACSRPFSLLGE